MNLLIRAIKEDTKHLDEVLKSSPYDRLGERKEELTLGQVDVLVDLLTENEWFKSRYTTDYDILFDALRYITQKQKRYIWLLVIEKKHTKLEEILNSLQIPKIN